jgi:hypothetical protein
MNSLKNDLYLPLAIVSEASELLLKLQNAQSASAATKYGIACEDLIRKHTNAGLLTTEGAARLYSVFDVAVDIKIRNLSALM